MNNQLIDIEQAAELLGHSTATIRRWVRQGKLQRVPGFYRIMFSADLIHSVQLKGLTDGSAKSYNRSGSLKWSATPNPNSEAPLWRRQSARPQNSQKASANEAQTIT